MKITITDGNSTLTLENNESMSSSKNKQLTDILFGISKPVVPKAQVTAQVTAKASRVPFPTDPASFEDWLNSEDPSNRAKQLSDAVGSDITVCTTMHDLVRTVPKFASKLGYARYQVAAHWLCDQGYVNYMPSNVSLRSYYSKSLRFARNMDQL